MIAILKIMLLFISFVGLCAGIRVMLKGEHGQNCIAPYLAVSGIIIVLCIGGMLSVLYPAALLLYALGIVGFVYAYIIKRSAPSPWLLLAFAAYVAFLIWRYYKIPLQNIDDISHWGLVARHLLRYDCFPDASATFVKFQSYPLGSASFIYYVEKLVGNEEWIYYVAQHFIPGALFLPVVANIKPGKKTLYVVSAALFAVFFHFLRFPITLRVDIELAFYGIALSGIIALERKNPLRAAWLIVPGCMAVVMIKSSGMFFAYMSIIACLVLMHKKGFSKKELLRMLPVVLLPIVFYLMWVFRIKLVYTNALSTKHAVSMSAYASEIQSKGASTIRQILVSYLNAAYLPHRVHQLLSIAYAVICLICILLYTKDEGMRRIAIRYYIYTVLVYLTWTVMLLGMYIVSMPTNEALELASFNRYNGTGLLYMMGMMTILMFVVMGKSRYTLAKADNLAAAASLCVLAGTAALYLLPNAPIMHNTFKRDRDLPSFRQVCQKYKEEYNLPDGGKYFLLINPQGNYTEALLCDYSLRYEFESAEIYAVLPYEGQYFACERHDGGVVSDPAEFIEENIEGCDAVFVLYHEDFIDEILENCDELLIDVDITEYE